MVTVIGQGAMSTGRPRRRALFCGGSPTSGSWEIRGRQIAAFHAHWTAVNAPTDEQINAAEVIVAVKRVKPELCARLRKSGKPVIWDALDFWKQPDDGRAVTTVAEARTLARPRLAALEPVAIIAANKAMEADLLGLADVVQCIYHPFKEKLAYGYPKGVMTYEGKPHYLGKWKLIVEAMLARIGWQFEMAPVHRGTAAVFAVRDGEHGSWLARRWKSNVKAANAISAAVPFVAWPEQAYLETVPADMGYWFETEAQLQQQIDRLTRPEYWLAPWRAGSLAHRDFTLSATAKRYEELFAKVL